MRDGPWRALYPFVPRRHGHGARALPGRPATPAAGQGYLDEGPPDGPPVVMVHGNPTWSFYFRGLVSAWRGRWRCLAPDHMGCGLSDRPAGYPYTLAAHVDNLDALLSAVLPPADRPGGRVVLLAHDWGGAIGMGFATRRPERVAGLIVTNSAAWPDLRVPARIRLCRVPVLGALAVRGLNLFARAASRMTTSRPLPPEVRAGYLAPYDSWAARVAVHRFVQDIPLSPRARSAPELERIAEGLGRLAGKPALVAWGMKDWCFSPHYLAGWKERLPGVRVAEFPDAAHYLQEDAGEEAERVMREFLEGLPSW